MHYIRLSLVWILDSLFSNVVKAPAIAVDAEASRVYFVNFDEKCVDVVNWDGENREQLISQIQGKPRGIALDIPRR